MALTCTAFGQQVQVFFLFAIGNFVQIIRALARGAMRFQTYFPKLQIISP